MTHRSSRLALAVAAASLTIGGCGPAVVEGTADADSVEASPTQTPTSASVSAASEASPPPTGAKAADQVAKARRMLAGLTVAGRAPKTGYDRTGSYGQTWADVTRSGCGARDNVLVRDLTDVGKRNACIVVSGTLADPYTASTIVFRKADAAKVQIDHVVPLALSWQLGAQQWPAGKRVTFANDPLNLLAVEGRANAQKSASGPDAWLPPHKAYRCTYVIRFTRVAAAYDLRVTDSMKDAITRELDRCRHVAGAPADLAPLPRTTWDYAAKFAPTTQPDASQPDASQPDASQPDASRPGAGSVAPNGSSCPARAPIKGNIPTDGGDRIYHDHSSRSYAATIPEVCFATARDAEDAGFRAPR